jgi:hypothetical protein
MRDSVRRSLWPVLLAFVLGLSWGPAWAAGVQLESRQLYRQDGALLLNAQFQIELPKKAAEALRRGVTLSFSQHFEFFQKRDWWLDESLFVEQRRYQLSYRSGADKYRLLLGAEARDFDTPEAALHALGEISGWVVGRQALAPGAAYEARLRLYLETNRLPQTLQLSHLFGSGLDVDSGWQVWKPNL